MDESELAEELLVAVQDLKDHLSIWKTGIVKVEWDGRDITRQYVLRLEALLERLKRLGKAAGSSTRAPLHNHEAEIGDLNASDREDARSQ